MGKGTPKKVVKPYKGKTVIGRCDRIDLPDMGLLDLDAKVDTGAYTAAIHCSEIKVVEENGVPILRFKLLDITHPAYRRKLFKVTDFTQRMIRNSFGQEEQRYIISTPLVIFGKEYLTEFSLSKRGNLKYPVLLGRKFLQKRFVVDVGRSNLSYKLKTKEHENNSAVQKP
jgi:hypothetical protein